MKKALMLFVAIIVSMNTNAQKPLLKRTGIGKIDLRKIEYPDLPSGQTVNYKKRNRESFYPTKSLMTVTMGTSANPYTLMNFRSNCLTVNNDLNLVCFTARTNEAGPVLGNNVAGYFSTNGGNSFNSTLMRPWTSPGDKYARFPSGVIINPTGNFNPTNAFLVVSGPLIVSGNWSGSFYASQKFNGTLRNEQYTLNTTDTAGGTGFLNRQPKLFMQSRNNKVFVLGDSNEDNSLYYTSINGVISIGEFQGDTVSWIRQIVTPDFELNTMGYPDGYGFGSLVMDDNGVTGYMVFNGRNSNASDSLTYQPIVFKTLDGGQSWNEEVFNWNNIASLQNIAAVLSPVDRPHFGPILDMVMDVYGHVHMTAMIHGAFSNHQDSLGTYAIYNNWKGIVYDIHQTSSGWDVFPVDTIFTQDAEDYPFWGFSSDERFQMSRTPDGSKIIYAWLDTDTMLEFTNMFSDIYIRVFDVPNNTLLPKVNITRNTMLDASCFWMYLGDCAFNNGDGTCTIPLSVSDHGVADTDPVTHYYISGVVINSTTGIITSISGKIYHDINENGQLDPGEQGAAGQRIKLEPGPYYTFTTNNGYYHFVGDTGNAIITYIPFPFWYSTSASSYSLHIDSAGQVFSGLDIGIKCRTNVQDVSVYLIGSPTRVGFDTRYWLMYKNWGTITASGTIEFQYDPVLSYLTSSITPISHTGNTLVYAYDTLGPGVQRMIRADFNVPVTVPFADTIYNYALINPIVPDTFITNNYDTLQQIITGSYDPNDKAVCPAGYEQWGFVQHGQRLSYTLRFQNTGNDTAFNVVLRDTISPHLDLGTILFEASSHNMYCEMHPGNEIYFIFPNILLPDSNVNEPESHGFVRYSISPNTGLTDGTVVTNTAYIFFDYNPAVVTNTTLNTFVTNIPVVKPILEVLKTLAFPNPSSDYIYINLPVLTSKVEVYNSAGSLVQQIIPNKQVVEIGIKDLPMGVYIVKLHSGQGIVSASFIKN
jgi:uncharacterized repeat protein (TIGR01451 family)